MVITRKTQLLAALLLLGLVPSLVGAIFLARSEQANRQKTHDTTLSQTLQGESSSLASYFDKARKQMLVGANKQRVGRVLPAAREPAPGGGVVDAVNGALAYFERLYPGAIGEPA